MAPLSNAQRQAAYRKRLREAATIKPAKLEELRRDSLELRQAVKLLAAAIAEMPEGPKRDEFVRKLGEFKGAVAAHAKVVKAIRDKSGQTSE